MYNELLASIDDYENVEITSLADEELLMNTILKCWYSMSMDPMDIVNNLLSILNCQDISIKDLETLGIKGFNGFHKPLKSNNDFA